MHVLWVIPDYYSFLVEELEELEKRVDRLSVISQEEARKIGNINCVTIPKENISLDSVFIRLKYIFRTLRSTKWPKSLSQWKSVRRIARMTGFIEHYVRDHSVDIIHSHFAVPDGTACSLVKGKIQKIVSLRGVDILTVPEVGYGFCLDKYYCYNLKQALRFVDAITVASATTLNALNQLISVPQNNVHLIPNGVDLEHLLSAPTQDAAGKNLPFGIDKNGMVLLAVGNLVPMKAFDDLLRVVAILVPKHRTIKLIIAGDGPEKKKLEELATELDIGDHLLLPGKVERLQMPIYFSACDVFVHFSRSEGFGNVVLEAMASAKPVVVTRTGFAADLIEDGVNGFTVDVGDSRALGENIGICLDNPTRAKAIGMMARESVREGFSLEERAKRFIWLYQQVLSQKYSREEVT